MSENSPDTPETEPLEKDRRIFVVHGQNNPMKEKVTGILNEFQLKPIFTQDPSNALKPIAQKVTEFSGVSSAVVLLSGDELVYSKEEKPHNALLKSNQKIVFELGFWIAKLGRENVVALYSNQKNFRFPTEYFDVIYVPFDKKSPWKTELTSRLKQWGYKTLENCHK